MEKFNRNIESSNEVKESSNKLSKIEGEDIKKLKGDIEKDLHSKKDEGYESDKVKDITDPKDYHRPFLRKEVREEIFRRCPKDADGNYIDANTGLPIEGTPDIGHKAGHEFWRECVNAFKKGLSQKEFNDFMNNPDFYQLEDPKYNRSHIFEEKEGLENYRNGIY